MMKNLDDIKKIPNSLLASIGIRGKIYQTLDGRIAAN
jgi:hypothetical protein